MIIIASLLISAAITFFSYRYAVRLARRKVIEEQNKKLYQMRMSFLSEMAGGISHEINNPLAIIQGQTYLLKAMITSDKWDADEAFDLLSKIESTTLRIAKIIRGLKAFSKNTENEPFVKCSVDQIIQDVLGLCGERLKNRGIKVILENKNQEYVMGRHIELVQAILNIIQNSFDWIQNQKDPWIKISTNSSGDLYKIQITDSGAGIKNQIADRMMEPFFTTKEVGEGTGLGLSITKGIIEAHKGEIYLDQNNSNTSFVISIPKYKQQSDEKVELKSA